MSDKRMVNGQELYMGYGAKLDGVDLSNAYFEDLRCETASFVKADLRDSTWKNCRLRGADLSGVSATYALMENIDLRNAILYGANFSGAILTGARMCKANFENANLHETNLHNVDLMESEGIMDFGVPHEIYRIYAVRHDDGIRIKAGCRWMTWGEAVRYWEREGDKKPLSGPLLGYIKAVVEIKGWKL